jgi:hypothetical protein
MSPELALQKAILAVLRADAGVSVLAVGGVHDQPPADPGYPLVTLGRSEVRPWGGLDGEGTEHALTLTVISRFEGTEEAKAIVAAIRVALHGASLTLDGWRLVNLRTTFSDVIAAADRRSTLGVMRIRAVVEPL